MRKIKRIVKYILVNKNLWYQDMFQDCPKFWKRFPFNLDIVNLGSSSAFYGFDYSELPVKGANWAMRPQSFPQDFAILKTYCSFLRPGAIILFSIGPYSSCFKHYKDIDLEKYYTILHPGAFENFSLERCTAILGIKDNPYKYTKKQMLLSGSKMLLKKIVKRTTPFEQLNEQPLDDAQLEADSQGWIDGWKKQFGIENMEASLSEHILEGRKKRIAVLKEMISFCREHEFQPVIVLPPVTSYLSIKFSEAFRDNYIYSFLQEANISDVPFLNYLDNQQFRDTSLYFNSFFLNRRGAKLFSKTVFEDLKANGWYE